MGLSYLIQETETLLGDAHDMIVRTGRIIEESIRLINSERKRVVRNG